MVSSTAAIRINWKEKQEWKTTEIMGKNISESDLGFLLYQAIEHNLYDDKNNSHDIYLKNQLIIPLHWRVKINQLYERKKATKNTGAH